MKIVVKAIPFAGVDIQGTISADELTIRPEEIKCLEPLVMMGRAEKQGHIIHAWGKAKTRFHYVCARCLAVFDKDFHQDFDFHYAIDAQMTVLDVGEDIRQEIILGFPERILCDEGCRGLCAGCGVDLNVETCECTKSKKGVKE